MRFPWQYLFPVIFCCIGTVYPDVDTFGITQFFPTKQGTRVWTSAHWNNGTERTVKYGDDQYDPTGWTEDHSSATDGFRIDGKGSMTMSGGGPRFHINSMDSSKVKAQFFRDVEFTAYYQRKGSAGENWGGMVMGVRSAPLGHASSGGNDCDASTYYARFRNDGKWDFEKELKHPGSTPWSGSGMGKQDPLWRGAPLPASRWIGMKYIVYNEKNDSRVKLELYIDSTSNGSLQNGGTWEKVGTVVDSGGWASGDVSGCGYAQNAIILQGHGTMLMRTDGDTAVYKYVSVREIVPQVTGVAETAAGARTTASAGTRQLRVIIVDKTTSAAELDNQTSRGRIYTLQGRSAHALRRHAGGTATSGAPGGVFIIDPAPHR